MTPFATKRIPYGDIDQPSILNLDVVLSGQANVTVTHLRKQGVYFDHGLFAFDKSGKTYIIPPSPPAFV